MEKFVPYAKMSKKLRKQTDRARRNTWGPLDPVTRVKKSGKLYDRKRARRRDDDRMGAFLLPSAAHGRCMSVSLPIKEVTARKQFSGGPYMAES